MLINYDGTYFNGYQIQPGVRTVQGELENVLSRITNTPVRIFAAARTDSGVHALGQSVNFHTSTPLSCAKLKKGLNALLSDDLSIMEINDVDISFHARFSAVSRSYLYLIDRAEVRSPFSRFGVVHEPGNLNLEAISECMAFLVGEHDFSSFKASTDSGSHGVRRMIKTDLWEKGKYIGFFFEANAFLQHMIRNIMGTLLWVGKSKLTVSEFKEVFLSRDRRKAGPTAPAHGLYLVNVSYSEKKS
ncbi:tRNA pseudouridine(38-40) synthase TruA [bacterium]|nr:tRNA pseudouridine(38-40) synthase TruA [candidate division CSSED10-310 bacterium]